MLAGHCRVTFNGSGGDFIVSDGSVAGALTQSFAWAGSAGGCGHEHELVNADLGQLVVVLLRGVMVERYGDFDFGRVAPGGLAEGSEPGDPLACVGGA